MFEQNLAGFYQSTAKGVIINCNQAFAKMLKYDSPQELLKVNAHELYFSTDERNNFINNVIEQKRLYNYEGVLKCKDGSALHFLENISEYKDPVTGEMFFDGTLINITQRKLAEFSLRESNERFINVSKATSDAIWDWDLLTGTVYWGEGFKNIFGYKELKNDINSWKDYIHPEEYDKVIKGIYEFIDGDEVNWIDEYRYLKTDQTYAYVIDKGFVIRDEQGKAIRMVGAMQDVTAKKELEDLLTKANMLARLGSWEVDMINNITYWSPMIHEIHEVEKDYVPALTAAINFIREGEDRLLLEKKLQESLTNGNPWEAELQIITAKGNPLWIRVNGDAEFVNEKCVRLYGSTQDINERKKAEIAAIEILKDKNTILESIGDGFFAVNNNWVVTYWNHQAEKILATPKYKILGHNLWEIFSKSIDSQSYKKYHEAFSTNQVTEFEDYYPVLERWFEISAYPSNNGLAVYFKDVTDRKHSEIHLMELHENLKKHSKELALSNSELEQFAYVASHDLQEPLRMITSFLVKLEGKYKNIIDDTGKTYIHFAVDGAIRMRQIILDLLEFSRIGRTENTLQELDLNKHVNEIEILFRKQIEEKKAVITVGVLPIINAYNAPLRQVFSNLISNALKYSSKNRPCEICISAEELESEWQFTIADNGIGILDKYFDKIFILFQRLHNKDEFSGTGIGLAITKKIIENLAGRIWVESCVGKGSNFHFTLPKNNIIEVIPE